MPKRKDINKILMIGSGLLLLARPVNLTILVLKPVRL